MKNWTFLSAAILTEVTATTFLKASQGFTKLWPSLVVIVGYAAAFYFLSLTLRTIPVGTAYAIWSGVGIALITLLGWLVYGQKLDLPGFFGIGLIVGGVLVLHLFSKAVVH